MKKISFPYLYTFREMRHLGYGYKRLHPEDEAYFHGYRVHFVTGGYKTQTIFSLIKNKTQKGENVSCVLNVFIRRRRLAVTINNMRRGNVNNITVRVIAKRHGWDDPQLEFGLEMDGSEYVEGDLYEEEYEEQEEEEAEDDDGERDISMEVNVGHYVAPLPENTKLLALVQITKTRRARDLVF